MPERNPRQVYREKALRMLFHNTHDYSEIAEQTELKIHELNLPLGGDRWLSLKSVSHFNLGISLELMLKFLLAWEKSPVSQDHRLARLYNGLSPRTRTRVERAYGTLALDDLALQAFALGHGPQAPPSPKTRRLHTVHDFFKYFDDDVRLWGKRYEWEQMNTTQWRHYLSDIRPFTQLVEHVMRGFFRL